MKHRKLLLAISVMMTAVMLLISSGCSSSIRRKSSDDDDDQDEEIEEVKDIGDEIVDLEAPKYGGFKVTVCGSQYAVYWQPVDGVDGYCVESSEDSLTVPNTFVWVMPDEGEVESTIKVRSYKKVGNEVHYSDWTKFTFQYPKPDITKVSRDNESCVLDYDNLTKWLEYKGITYSSYTANGYRYVVASKEDPKNTGFVNNLLRVGKVYFREYINSIPNALKDNLKGAILNNQTVEEYFNSAKQDASTSALFEALGAVFSDTCITMVYQYNENGLYNAPNGMWIYMLKSNRGFSAPWNEFGITQIYDDGYGRCFPGVYEAVNIDHQGMPSQCFVTTIWEDGDYWVAYSFRTDFDPASPMRLDDSLIW